jgi:uncharacterized protein involved in high-affinity Fe2+ transport
METPNYNSEVRFENPILVFDDDSTGWGEGQKVPQFSNLQFEVLTADSADLTVQCFVSYQEDEPTWGDPVDEDNRYVSVGYINLSSQVLFSGAGENLTSDELNHYMASINGATWVNFLVTISAGEAKVWLNQFNNQ